MFTIRSHDRRRFERKNARAEGKVKDAKRFKDIAAVSISELLIISINGLMHLFRAVKTAQGLVSLTLPGASLRAGFPLASAREQPVALFLFASYQDRDDDNVQRDNDLTPNPLPTCYTHAHPPVVLRNCVRGVRHREIGVQISVGRARLVRDDDDDDDDDGGVV